MALRGILLDKCFENIPAVIQLRTSKTINPLEPGEASGSGIEISENIMVQTNRTPAVIVNAVVGAGEDYDAYNTLQYYGWVKDNGVGNGGSVIFRVKNNGSSTVSVPNIAIVVL